LIKIDEVRWSMDYLTPEEMRELERRAAQRGIGPDNMMERAGKEVAEVIDSRYRRRGTNRVLVLCGLGNNGGDGLVVAHHLKKKGWSVLVLLLGLPSAIKTPEARANWVRAESSVVPMRDAKKLLASRKYFDRSDVIVDAIVGTGVRGGLRDPASTAVAMMNASGAAKVAVDVPSGLDPESGDVEGEVVRADVTVALHRAKTGLRGRDEYTGEVIVVPIGVE
jgi:hydroxyethylthiazole kinase-like uncharacterized protein yjeF